MTQPRSPLINRNETSLDLTQLESAADDFDADVSNTNEIDQFCSSSFWTLPAAIELMPPRTPAIRRSSEGWLAFMQGEHAGSGRYLEPLESSWGLACPLIGRDPTTLVKWFADVLEQSRAQWDLTLLAGVPSGSQLLINIAHILSKRFRVLRHAQSSRHVASLIGGMDAFLSRRTPNFRRSLRRAQIKAGHLQLQYEHHCPQDAKTALALFDRVQSIECNSWKGIEEVGIATGSFGAFYRNMVPRMARRGSLHVLFVKHEGRDIAFFLGGLFGDTFRGLQASFNEQHRAWSLGNLCQLAMLERLPKQVRYYDLGSAGLQYKTRWAEQTITSEVLVVLSS